MPHRFVTAKSPVTCTLILVSALSPLLLTVTCCAALVVPIACAAKVSAMRSTHPSGRSARSRSAAPSACRHRRWPPGCRTRRPTPSGEKTTPTVQLVFTASDEPQVFAEMVNGPADRSAASVPRHCACIRNSYVLHRAGLPDAHRSKIQLAAASAPSCPLASRALHIGRQHPALHICRHSSPSRCAARSPSAQTRSRSRTMPLAANARRALVPLKTKSLLLTVAAQRQRYSARVLDGQALRAAGGATACEQRSAWPA